MRAAVISKERMYEVLRGPVITEKSTMISEHNQVTFRVAKDSSKPEIMAAVEGLFGVKVKAAGVTDRNPAGSIGRRIGKGGAGKASGGVEDPEGCRHEVDGLGVDGG